MAEPNDPTPADAVHSNGAHAQNTEQNQPGSESSLPPAEPASAKPPRRRVPPRRRTVKKPELTPERLFFFVDDNKHIDLDRVQPETLERLKTAFSGAAARQALGLVNDAGEPTPPRTWTNMTSVLIDSLNALAVQFAVNTWKLSDDQARLLFLRTDPAVYQQTTQLSGELLDKYFPGGFGEYDKEISLLLLVGGFTVNAVQKIQAMKATGPAEVRSFTPAAHAHQQ